MNREFLHLHAVHFLDRSFGIGGAAEGHESKAPGGPLVCAHDPDVVYCPEGREELSEGLLVDAVVEVLHVDVGVALGVVGVGGRVYGVQEARALVLRRRPRDHELAPPDDLVVEVLDGADGHAVLLKVAEAVPPGVAVHVLHDGEGAHPAAGGLADLSEGVLGDAEVDVVDVDVGE